MKLALNLLTLVHLVMELQYLQMMAELLEGSSMKLKLE
jgi:hypothetical protein